MKCPNCGTDMKDGDLYCEVCGEEIHIVPDFEPEIEYSISETLSGISEDVLEEVPDEKQGSAVKKEITANKRKLKRIIAIGALTLLLIIGAAAAVIGIRNYRYNSVQYQISRAQACVASGNVEEALGFYQRAVELEENIYLRFQLAALYEQNGQNQEYVNTLSFIISSPYTTEDELETAYKRLIAYFRDREDYASINTLLINTENEAIRNMFQHYMAAPPEFSYTEGTYAEVIPLKLSASTQGTIYYTTDGTLPSDSSDIYTTPIFLDTGTFVITAMFVNEYGISSEVVAKTYIIDIMKPPAPEVETYSGEYTSPTMIKVVVPADGTVYYTTDGSIPTDHSAQYREAIPMPLGKSTFKFIIYNEEGVCGSCTTRQYELVLPTDFTVDMALQGIKEELVLSGKLLDTEGTIAGNLPGRYIYAFQSAQTLAGMGDFYILTELYEDSAGVQNRTGTIYAVDIYTQTYYKLIGEPFKNPILELING
ncbi:MAG: chitobiase/beta-hexosaminidase C-terminal domain-containing protein [Lachnospiraceae bacterium]|nr:chitobiase/beta-hexosaminidase C-terminal domain-containing protein [Lachnospiraceae bacterium]